MIVGVVTQQRTAASVRITRLSMGVFGVSAYRHTHNLASYR